MKKSVSKGFTLIELLVVIAIIGILASIVLVNLNSARSKGTDAKIKSELSNLRAEGEIYYDSHGNSYASFDTGDTTAARIKADTSATFTYATDGSAWAASATLADGSTKWCVDSSGHSATSTGSASGVCA